MRGALQDPRDPGQMFLQLPDSLGSMDELLFRLYSPNWTVLTDLLLGPGQ